MPNVSVVLLSPYDHGGRLFSQGRIRTELYLSSCFFLVFALCETQRNIPPTARGLCSFSTNSGARGHTPPDERTHKSIPGHPRAEVVSLQNEATQLERLFECNIMAKRAAFQVPFRRSRVFLLRGSKTVGWLTLNRSRRLLRGIVENRTKYC